LLRDEIQILHMENVLILEKSYLLTESDSSHSLPIPVGQPFVYSRQPKKFTCEQMKGRTLSYIYTHDKRLSSRC